MSHDYLYRRHQTSRQAAQSWQFPTSTPGLPEEPVTPGTPLFPSRAPGVRRAAAVAYLIISTFVIPDAAVALPVELQTQLFPDSTRIRQARTHEAYYRFFSQKAGGPDRVPEGESLLPDRAPGPRRTANTAYWIPVQTENIFAETIIEEDLRRREFPESAPGPRRAANTAYWIDSRQEDLFAEVIPVELFRRELPEIARGARRAANSAYWIDNRLAVVDVTVRQDLIPDRADGPRRAANQAYWIDQNRLANEAIDLPIELQKGILLQDIAPGPRRTANTAYWLPSRLEDLFAEVPLVVVRRKEVRRGWYRSFGT